MSERWEPETIPMRENLVEIRDESGRRVCAVPADYPLSGHSWNRRIALIAAAPEMFELITNLSGAYEGSDEQRANELWNEWNYKYWHLAQAAKTLLAKIEGGEA